MDRWLTAALDYVPRWLDFQMRMSEQPGCIISIAHRDRIVLERAWGHGEPVRCVRAKSGRITALWLGAGKLLPAAGTAREMEARYGKPARRAATRQGRT